MASLHPIGKVWSRSRFLFSAFSQIPVYTCTSFRLADKAAAATDLWIYIAFILSLKKTSLRFTFCWHLSQNCLGKYWPLARTKSQQRPCGQENGPLCWPWAGILNQFLCWGSGRSLFKQSQSRLISRNEANVDFIARFIQDVQEASPLSLP